LPYFSFYAIAYFFAKYAHFFKIFENKYPENYHERLLSDIPLLQKYTTSHVTAVRIADIMQPKTWQLTLIRKIIAVYFENCMKPTITIGGGGDMGLLMLQQKVHVEISVSELASKHASYPLSSSAELHQRIYPTYRYTALSAESAFLRGEVK
jgi:hypothetical protein